jgi:hypothetical protein
MRHQRSQFVESRFRQRIEQPVSPERGQTRGFIGRSGRAFHNGLTTPNRKTARKTITLTCFRLILQVVVATPTPEIHPRKDEIFS